MKRMILILLSLILVLGVFGCGKKEEKSVQDIYKEITEKIELPDMTVLDDETIEGFYGIGTDKFSDYIFSESLVIIQVDSVVIAKVKDKKDLEETKKNLQIIIDNKAEGMKNYLVEKYNIVKKASVKSKGNTVYLVISEHAEEIEKIIESYIG